MKNDAQAMSPHIPGAASTGPDRETKVRLATAIIEAIKERQLSQSEAAALLRIPQPKVSALVNYRLEGFSVQRLFRALNALGRDVLIQITTRKKPGSAGKTSVKRSVTLSRNLAS